MKSPDSLTVRYKRNIAGEICCFDRIILFGTYKPIGYPQAMAKQAFYEGVQYIDYEKKFANSLRLQMVDHMKAAATDEGIEIVHVHQQLRKEEYVTAAIKDRGEHEGVVCILSAMESCSCFKVRKNHRSGFLELQWSPGKCLHYYVYFIDAELGLCYLRIPTWAPFRLQFYCNGHSYLERQMKKRGIKYEKADNCFVRIADFQRAQQIADSFDIQELHQRLRQYASRFVAIHERWGHGLYWSISQAEYATDIVFKSNRILPDLFHELVRTAAGEVRCSDIYSFMGKRLTESSAQEVSSRLKTLVEGTRIKHILGTSSIKMYDKQQRVLRIETTVNDVSVFKHYREVKHRDGSCETKYASVRKSIYSLGVLSELMGACNKRYVHHISQWEDHTKERIDLRKVSQSVKDDHNRSYRGVNFFQKDDLQFMYAIERGEYTISGFSNRQLQQHLPGWKPAKIGRMIKRFRKLGLIKRATNTYKYYLRKLGQKVIVAALQVKERVILPAMARA